MVRLYYYLKISGLVILIGLVYLTFFLQIANNQKIAWGVKIANIRIGGHDIATSRQILKNKWDDFANQEIMLAYQGNSWSTKLTNLGFQIDVQASLNQAYQIGHRSNALTHLKEQLAALIGYYNLEPIYTIDQEKFQKQTTELFKNIERPAQNATLVFDEKINDFLLQPSAEGITVDRDQLLADLSECVKSFSIQPITLKLAFDYPSVENDEVDSARQKAKQILAHQPYQLIFEGKIWTINQKRLINWLKFEPTMRTSDVLIDNQILGLFLDKEKIKEYLKQIAATIDRPPTNAQLETKGNRAIVFSPAKDGFTVKIDKTINRLTQNILNDPPIKKTTIIASKASPEITLRQTNNLGINSLIGQGTSNFAGSPKNRIHNIKTGTAKFNGLILNPGEEFSFNNLLGGSGPEQGFLPELVIKKNKTIPEYGGGLCQVSTTLFRAAVKTGLKITERQAHAFPVEYYHPQGFDATVYEPHPDLRFINNTPGHLLIEGMIEGNQLIFNFYGTDDGRQVKIKGPYVLEKKEDGSMKTVLTQEVYKDGELFFAETFYSNYKSPDLYPIETAEDNNTE
jgi:vancomycin resistance protein YoaR